MYMDNQLPPDPAQPEGRVFSSYHLVKTPEKPSKSASDCILYLTQVIYNLFIPEFSKKGGYITIG